MKTAFLQEIFTSIQGEGLFVGARHIFVRFFGCDIRCAYCDTPAALQEPGASWGTRFCSVQRSPGSDTFDHTENPVSAADLTMFCESLAIPGPSRAIISLTGGEPLLQSEFLAEWLPSLKPKFEIYLETSGIHAQEMQSIRDMVDIISMDFKLPSAAGLKPLWEEHRNFIAAARGKTLFVKAVVTGNTSRDDILTSARLIADRDDTIPFVIQPATGLLAPQSTLLIDFQNAALGIIRDVRVIPQMHKILNVR